MNALRQWVMVVVVLFPLFLVHSQEPIQPAPDTTANPSPGWSFYSLAPSEFLRLPGRTYQYYLPLFPGVVDVNGDVHVRGSRSYENIYVLEGFNVTNPITNTNGFELIPEATELIEVHTGVAGSSYYSANGGLIMSRMRQGGDRLEAFAEYRTDDLVSSGESAFGTVPLGVNNIVATLGGPVVEGIRFFAAGQYRHMQNRQSIFLEPFQYEGLTDDGFQGGGGTKGRLLVAPDSADRGSLEIMRNFLEKNWIETISVNGNVLADLEPLAGIPLKVQLLGIYGSSIGPEGGSWPDAMYNYYRREERLYTDRSRTYMLAGRARHDLIPALSYEIGVSYQYRFAELYDANYGRNTFEELLEIPDSAAAAQRGFNTSEWRYRYSGPPEQSTIFGFRLIHPEAPNNRYTKEKETNVGLTLDMRSRLTTEWELEAGARLDSWTLRRYSFENIRSLLSYLDPDWDGDRSDGPVFSSEYAKRVAYLKLGTIVNWGYSYMGDETNGGSLSGSNATLDEPYKPLFASAYAGATYKNGESAIHFGLRYEFIDPALKTVNAKTPTGKPDFDRIPYDPALGIMDESAIDHVEPFRLLLPRVSVKFGAGGTQLFAGFGQYAQMPPYNLLMQSNLQFSQSVSPDDRFRYSFGQQNVAFSVKPERSTLYEAGAQITAFPKVTLSGTLYYKSMKDQLQMGKYYDDTGEWILSMRASEGNGTAKGLELSATLHRSGGLAVWLNYALSSATGITSNPLSNAVQVTDDYFEDTLVVSTALDYQQIHKAALVVDFRTSSDEGLLWGNVGISAIMRFSSGHPYTKENARTTLGSVSPWTIGTPSLYDPRWRRFLQAEPTNSSETPNVLNIDLRLSKGITLGSAYAELWFAMLNVLDTKSALNVYPATGSTTGDGWYETSSFYFDYFKEIPLYSSFYRDININNRWAYAKAAGYDLFSSPRQFLIGLSIRY